MEFGRGGNEEKWGGTGSSVKRWAGVLECLPLCRVGLILIFVWCLLMYLNNIY